MVITTEHIKQAQDALRAKGLIPGEGGRLDDKTQQALQAFQKMNGLPVTGVLDDKTAAKLGVNLASGRR
jgi:carboxyl-terminal processing protease